MRGRPRLRGGADTALTPEITSVSPSTAVAGDVVTVTGSGFRSPTGAFPADLVTVGTARALPTVASRTALTFTVPEGPEGLSDVRVRSPGGTALATGSLTVSSLAGPEVSTLTATTLPVPTSVGLPVVQGFSVNARIQPGGLPCTWRVDYGATSEYGSTTAARALPGKLAAHYEENWADGTNGWLAGMSRTDLTYQSAGGPDNSPFVRYTDAGTSGDDPNHADGIGYIHLGSYAYIGHYDGEDVPPLYLGGGFPDLRGAQLSYSLRGNAWTPNGSTIGTWIQGFRDPQYIVLAEYPAEGREPLRYPNWAYTGNDERTSLVLTGNWETASWTLENRTDKWTFGGANGGRELYSYGELDALLSKVTVDLFVTQILGTEFGNPPSGSLDYANFRMTFRQHSVCATSNGGTLLSSPAGGTGTEYLTDGYRNGSGREWVSELSPTNPQEFVYGFTNPITLDSVTVCNSVDYPSQGIEIAVSEDGGENWTTLYTGDLPESHVHGPNFAFVHHNNTSATDAAGNAIWSPIHPNPVDRLRVRVTSGYGLSGSRWGLGEIEAFGTGATEQTDDAWYDVNQDVQVASGTWHYRIVATTSEGTTYGPDQTVTVP